MNREERKIYMVAYREKHRERDKRWKQAHWKKNKERIMQYREANKDKIRGYKRKWKMKAKTIIRHRMRDKKKVLVDLKGGKCSICGYSKCLASLQFHHIDPTTKSNSHLKIINLPMPKAKEEVAKCILVCANCHFELHTIKDGPI